MDSSQTEPATRRGSSDLERSRGIGWEAGIRAERGEEREPREAWKRAEQPRANVSERSGWVSGTEFAAG
jgi:hypothetical protein